MSLAGISSQQNEEGRHIYVRNAGHVSRSSVLRRLLTKKLAVLVSVMLAVSLSGCTAGKPFDERRSTSDPDDASTVEVDVDLSAVAQIELASFADVRISFGDTASLTLTAQPRVARALVATVENQTLSLRTTNERMSGIGAGATYNLVVTRRLEDIVVNGSGDLEAEGVAGQSLEVRAGGSGNLVLTEIAGQSVDAYLSGSGDVSLDGEAQTLTLTATGSGDFDSSSLFIEDAVLASSGSGDVAIHAARSITGTLGGSGDLRNSGEGDPDVAVIGSGELLQGE